MKKNKVKLWYLLRKEYIIQYENKLKNENMPVYRKSISSDISSREKWSEMNLSKIEAHSRIILCYLLHLKEKKYKFWESFATLIFLLFKNSYFFSLTSLHAWTMMINAS